MNWQQILWELRREFGALTKVAREIDVSAKTLQSIARDGASDVYYSLGVKLIELHNKHCNDATKTRRSLSTERMG